MFSVAGADTVAVSMTLTLHYVLSIPKVRDRLSVEIRSKFDKSEDITGQSTAMLPYLGAVVQEGASSFDLPYSSAANPSRSNSGSTKSNATRRNDDCRQIYPRGSNCPHRIPILTIDGSWLSALDDVA